MKNGSKKFYIVGSFITLILIACVAVLIGVLSINPTEVKAERDNKYEVVIERIATVTVYVQGSGVTLYESDHAGDDAHTDLIHDVYLVEKGTNITLLAVNESKIFTSWNVQTKDDRSAYTGNGSTNSEETITVNEDLVVSVNRRDPNTSDIGKYMTNRFLIEGAKDLYLLQEVFKIGTNVTEAALNTKIYTDKIDATKDVTLLQYYNNMFKDDPTWKSYSTNDKYVAGINGTFFNRLQYGYYLVTQNFAYLDVDNNMPFTGIGTATKPFNGVFCGLNNGIKSTISLVINETQKAGNSYYGLFGYLGNSAVVRNIKIQTSIGIDSATDATNSTIFAGGLAGRMDNSFLYDVDITSRNSIDINDTARNNNPSIIYSGGIAGYMTGGIEEYADVIANGTDAGWILQSTHHNTNIYAGLLAGYATSAYVNHVELKVSGFAATVKNLAADDGAQFKTFIGNLFGSYVSTNQVNVINNIRNIKITGTAAQNLSALINRGNAYVGGLIGQVDATNANTYIGKVNFQISNKNVTSKITASSIDATSRANMYTAGLIAEVVSNNLHASDEFKDSITELDVEGKKHYRYDFIFNGNYLIEAINNGYCSTTTGRVISAGLVAHGLFNIDGQDDKPSEILLSSSDYTLEVRGTQTAITTGITNANILDHCMTGLVFGYIDLNTGEQPTEYNFNNINIYSNNSKVIATRELTSKAVGDIHVGGFIGYSRYTNYNNINLYFNDTEFRADSLSYNGVLNAEGNSNFVGALIGETIGVGSAVNNWPEINNIRVYGFDYINHKEIGHTIKMASIQNTIPVTGTNDGENYRGENYIGGVIGRTRQTKIDNVTNYGSVGSEDYIQMQGHQSPDSAFCGGIIGFARNSDQGHDDLTFTNLKAYNLSVYCSATVTNENYSDPDVFAAGILGAVFCEQSMTFTLSQCSVENSEIKGIGNERVQLATAGILGYAAWSGTVNIQTSYVYDSEISADYKSVKQYANNRANARSGGILGRRNSSTVNINGCGVFDTAISADGGGVSQLVEASGISHDSTVSDCYSNAFLSGTNARTGGTVNVYGISPNSTNSYYHDQNAGNPATGNTSVSFSNIKLDTDDLVLFTSMSGKYYTILENQNIFKVDDSDKTIVNYDSDTNTSNNAHIWVNIYGIGRRYGLETNVPDYSQGFWGGSESRYISQVSFTISDRSLEDEIKVYFGSHDVTSNHTLSGSTYTVNINGNPNADNSGQRFTIVYNGTDELVLSNISYNYRGTNQNDNLSGTLSNYTFAKINPEEVKSLEDMTLEERHEKGWFQMGTVLVYNGTANDGGAIDAPAVSYPTGDKEYVYQASTNTFKNKFYPYDEIENTYEKNIGYTEETDSDTFKNIKFNNKYVIKVRDDIPQIKVSFTVPSEYSTLTETFFDNTKDHNVLSSLVGIGNYSFTSTTEGDSVLYEFIFTPNTEIEKDTLLFIGFKVGNTDTYLEYGFQLDIKANTRTIAYVTYADYTPPINYQDKISGEHVIGCEHHPYLLQRGTTTKFIPVFRRVNDLPLGKDELGNYIYPEYNSELNVDYVTYTLSNANNMGTMKTNGEFVSADDATLGQNKYNITVTLKNLPDDFNSLTDEQKKQYQQLVYVDFVTNVKVTYAGIGVDISGLTYATGEANYILELNTLEHYGGLPINFNIDIVDGSSLNKNTLLTSGWVYDKDGYKVSEWDLEKTYYKVIIPSGSIKGNITIDIEMEVVYTITFDLQCASFNTNYTGPQTLKMKVKAGTIFNQFFDDEMLQKISNFEDGAISVISGYLCTGFFLVDEADSEVSYGVKFDDLKNTSIAVNTSYTFYARWNFLIELVEAPGTHIQSSFADSFMIEVDDDKFVNRTIAIPINSKRGYVFSITKDEGFIGEANVNAYIISNVNSSEEIITEIPIEKYHENMYLYYIAPEKITGYLVIVTSVSNSEVIVGENTAQVVDEILPEDGIFTFKYAVNHKNGFTADGLVDRSYIYDSGKEDVNYNLNLTKDLSLQFLDLMYNVEDKKLKLHERNLPKGTIIEVYYNLYINNSASPVKTVVGVYVVQDSNTYDVRLSEFKKLNLDEAAFEQQTFKEFLGSNESVSEVYYFVVTPPNGFDKETNKDGFGNIEDELVFIGYVDPEKEEIANNLPRPSGHKDEFAQYDIFVEGKRTSKEFANIPIEGEKDKFDVFVHETSLQQRLYALTPSRHTELTVNGDEYTFVDSKKFNYIQLTLSNGAFNGSTLRLFDDKDFNTILTSGIIENGIQTLKLNLGYSIGNIDFYGSVDGINYELVETLYVDEISYKDYEVDFTNSEKVYHYFRIDNKSLAEIRLTSMSLINLYYGHEFDLSGSTFAILGEVTDANGTHRTYVIQEEIVNDIRHDGKYFMFAVQFKNGGSIVEDIDVNNASPIRLKVSYIDRNGQAAEGYINCNLSSSKGKNVLYFDLTSFMNSEDIEQMSFTIENIPSGYNVSCVQLIETTSAEKPAMGEVRTSITY